MAIQTNQPQVMPALPTVKTIAEPGPLGGPAAPAAPAAPAIAGDHATTAAPAATVPGAVNLENIDLEEGQILANMAKGMLGDGQMSAKEQAAYKAVFELFAGSKKDPGGCPGASASSPSDPLGGSKPVESQPVILLGNKRNARSVKSFLKIMQRRGIKLPFDINKLDPAVLKMKIPKGQTLALGHDGKIVGMTKTDAVMADSNLGLQNHLKKGSQTHTTGGDVEIEGKTLNVSNSFLASPVMLDLNHDGKLGTTGVSTASKRVDNVVGKTVDFDIDADGDLDKIEWMDGKGDGMLVDDRDGGATAAASGNGMIDGSRLYGDQGGKYDNGYTKLARHDANADGKLTGEELAGLKTWVDDGDARVEDGELKTLAELGVTEISVNMELQKNARNEDLMRSTFVQNGETHATEDVWFAGKK